MSVALLGDRLAVDHDLEGTLLDRVTSATVSRSLDGPVQLRMTVRDHPRLLWTSDLVAEPTRLTVDQDDGAVVMRLAGARKDGSQLTLRWVDDIVWRLRGATGFRERGDGDVSALAGQLADEVGVSAAAVQPGGTVDGAQVSRGHDSERTAAAGDESSWDALRRYADQLDWRLCSLGRILLFAGDDWLLAGHAVAAGGREPIDVVEHDGPVGVVDGDVDDGKRAQTATVQVHDITAWTGEAWGPAPSTPIRVDGLGPLSGRWLIAEVSLASLWSRRATVRATRANEDAR